MSVADAENGSLQISTVQFNAGKLVQRNLVGMTVIISFTAGDHRILRTDSFFEELVMIIRDFLPITSS